jgi:hypothetical protein
MRTRTSVLIASAWLGAAGSAAAQATHSTAPLRVTVVGIVVDSTDDPIAGVAISLDGSATDAEQHTRSAADGRFTLAAVRPGTRSIQLRRIGYTPLTLAVPVPADTAPTFIPITLVASPIVLDPVAITENPIEPEIRMRDFDALREQGRFGYFIDQQEIRRRGPSNASELLRRVPGALLRASNGIGNTVRFRGCRPMVWLDNVSLPGAEVDEVARTSDIAGMAVYPSWGSLPARYMDRRAGNCGAILIWTR